MNTAPAFGESLLSFLPLADRAKEDLKARMLQPTRFYHTLQHLEILWGRHLDLRGQTRFANYGQDALVAAAIAYHDAVYVAGAFDNEERSADLWLEVSSTATGFSERDRLWVAGTIRATADHLAASRTIDVGLRDGYMRQWVLDLDLTPLGEEPDVFDRNVDLLRAEAACASTQANNGDPAAALRRFAAAKPLYRCPPIKCVFEDAARHNFDRHLR